MNDRPRPRLVCSPTAALLCLAALGAPVAAHAQSPDATPALFVQAGSGEASVDMVGAGLRWPLGWQRPAGGGVLSLQLQAFVSGWRTQPVVGDGHRDLVQLGAVPLLRWRGDAGRSPWFVEGGIGLSVLDRKLETPAKTFSTRWNFSDTLAVGYTWGDTRQHELSLRWQHTSNAGLRKPNPGLDLGMVRYAVRF
jgi:hypothetical protein